MIERKREKEREREEYLIYVIIEIEFQVIERERERRMSLKNERIQIRKHLSDKLEEFERSMDQTYLRILIYAILNLSDEISEFKEEFVNKSC